MYECMSVYYNNGLFKRSLENLIIMKVEYIENRKRMRLSTRFEYIGMIQSRGGEDRSIASHRII